VYIWYIEPLIDELWKLAYEGMDCECGRKLLSGGELYKIHVRGGLIYSTSDLPATPAFTNQVYRGLRGACKNCWILGAKCWSDLHKEEEEEDDQPPKKKQKKNNYS
jgi:hypothetical protein